MGTTARSPGLSSITARQWMILLSVQLSSLLFGMTITLANVVLPQIRGALSATYDEIAWVVTLNLVATAISQYQLKNKGGFFSKAARAPHGFRACDLIG